MARWTLKFPRRIAPDSETLFDWSIVLLRNNSNRDEVLPEESDFEWFERLLIESLSDPCFVDEDDAVIMFDDWIDLPTIGFGVITLGSSWLNRHTDMVRALRPQMARILSSGWNSTQDIGPLKGNSL